MFLSLFFIFINNFFLNSNLMVIKGILNFFLSFVFVFLFKLTDLGKKMVLFFWKTKFEICNVIWPSIVEVTKTVLVIFFLSVLISLVIWLIDNFILYLISIIINLGHY